jgi:hypothetical protein
MWPTIDRARRRLIGAADDPAPGATGGSTAATASAAPSQAIEAPATTRRVEDVVVILGRVELDQLRAALQNALGDAVERPNTPARLERALSLLLARRGAPGRPRVLRRPAAVSTPESWEIHLDGVDRASGTAVRDASRTGRFAA